MKWTKQKKGGVAIILSALIMWAISYVKCTQTQCVLDVKQLGLGILVIIIGVVLLMSKEVEQQE